MINCLGMVGLFTAVNLLICITNLQKGNKLCTVAYIYFDHSHFFMQRLSGIPFLKIHFGKQYSRQKKVK